MLVRALPLLRVLAVVLVVAVVVLLGAVGWVLLFSNNEAVPRTELERGLSAAEEAVKANPEDATARIKLAAAYLENKQYEAAVEQADLAARLNPKDPTPLYIVGVAKDATGDYQGAIATLTKATATTGQLAAFYQDSFSALSRAYEHAGNADKALEAMNKAIDLGPENAILLLQRGQMFERAGKFTDALQDYSWALDYVPGYEPAKAAFEAVSSAHPDALKALQEQQEKDSKETTSTAGAS